MNWLKELWDTLTTPRKPGDTSKFSPATKHALIFAREEARRLNHNFVGTEHLLLGIVALGQGRAVNVLKKSGLSLESVRSEIEKQVGRGPDQKVSGKIPYTPRVKKVLALAVKESQALNHGHVGTEHILLGMLREGDGVAGRVLKKLGLELEKTRREVLQLQKEEGRMQNEEDKRI